MLASELDYDLPEAQIAQYPLPQRDASRLLVVPRSEAEPPRFEHLSIRDFASRVPESALLVLNDTRVMKARVFAERATGGKVELLFLGPAQAFASDAHAGSTPSVASGAWEALVRANRRLPVGDVVSVGSCRLELGTSTPEGARLVTASMPIPELIAQYGHVPLPPYVRRPDESSDHERYQTVFARHEGSAAAPTAGLHVTEPMLQSLRARGVELGFATLHVGAGTFRPVSVERLDQHPMHSEWYSISPELARQVGQAKREGRPVVAVGTTVVRALESAALRHLGLEQCAAADAASPEVAAGNFETRLLISPGYRLQIVDALLTNFHAPRSTLLALVFAFAGRERIRAAYAEAIAQGYRFLSYGDAMWIPPHSS
jgi:S-adenosylmethionine:tRNA ribosyltransferase-isomerase